MLAAIWGASHAFSRVMVPVLGPFHATWFRIVVAVLTLAFIFFRTRQQLKLMAHRKTVLMVSLLNTALPFTFFALAARALPASILSVLNATAPLFSGLFSVVLLGEAMTARKLLGLTLGMLGVVWVKASGSVELHADLSALEVTLAFVLGLSAAACYGLAGVLLKKWNNTASPTQLSIGGMGLASVLLFPSLLIEGSPHFGDPRLVWAVLGVLFTGALSTAMGFIWFYRLIEEVGPFKASIVTFLMPIFGVLWGVLFLGETLQISMVLGASLVLISTRLLVAKSR